MPTAVRLVLNPTNEVGENGVIWRLVSVAEVTVSSVELVCPLQVALMVALPLASVCACPFEPFAVLIAAMLGADEVHVASAVTFTVVLSLYTAVALKVTFVPTATLGCAGVTWTCSKVPK